VKQYKTNSAIAEAESLLTEETIGSEAGNIERSTISRARQKL